MSITVLGGIVILMLLLAGLIYLPFLAERRLRTKDAATASLDDQLQRLVHSVRDLDFDYDTGKVISEEYVTQRKLLIGRGVSALIKLDEAQQALHQTDHALEAEIAQYRLKKAHKKT